ncbi:MAG: hypothetical protein Q9164_006487 [Protoblastenia rupestris]
MTTTHKIDPEDSAPVNNEASTSADSRLRAPQVFSQLRGIPTKHIWDFYHEKHSETSDYKERLTLLHEKIDDWRIFMQVYNNFPFGNLRLRDSVHLFKYKVKPLWEFPRNASGGAWIIRVPKHDRQGNENKDRKGDFALQLMEQVVFAAGGEQFLHVIQPHDDLCGISFSKRLNSSLIMIWTRQADNEKTKQGIKSVLSGYVTDNLKPLLEDHRNSYYKRHREHVGFDVQLAKTLAADTNQSPDSNGQGRNME